MKSEVRVIADSVSSQGTRLTTMALITRQYLNVDWPRELSVYIGHYMEGLTMVTATDWEPFLSLDSVDVSEVTDLIRFGLQLDAPRLLSEGEWHLPFINEDERDGHFEFTEDARLASAARCTGLRFSVHSTHRFAITADVSLSKNLIRNGRTKAFEHVATPFTADERLFRNAAQLSAKAWATKTNRSYSQSITRQMMYSDNLHGWTSLRRMLMNDCVEA